MYVGRVAFAVDNKSDDNYRLPVGWSAEVVMRIFGLYRLYESRGKDGTSYSAGSIRVMGRCFERWRWLLGTGRLHARCGDKSGGEDGFGGEYATGHKQDQFTAERRGLLLDLGWSARERRLG